MAYNPPTSRRRPVRTIAIAPTDDTYSEAIPLPNLGEYRLPDIATDATTDTAISAATDSATDAVTYAATTPAGITTTGHELSNVGARLEIDSTPERLQHRQGLHFGLPDGWR